MKKQVVYFFLSIVLIAFVSVASLPWVFSSKYGKRWLLGRVNQQIAGSVDIDKLQLNWFGTQKARNVRLFDPKGDTVLRVEAIEISGSLINLIWDPQEITSISLSKIDAVLVEADDGRTNLDWTLTRAMTPFEGNNANPITFTEGSAEYHRDFAKQAMQFELKGNTSCSDGQGEIRIEGHATATSLKDLLSPMRSHVLRAKIRQFPVELLDAVIALRSPAKRGMVTGLLGRTIDVTIDVTDAQGWEMIARSSTLDAHLKGQLENGVFTVVDSSRLQLEVTPKFAKTFDFHQNIYALTEPFQLDLTIKELQLPFSGKIDQASWDLQLQTNRMRWMSRQGDGQLIVDGMRIATNGVENQPLANFTLDTQATYQDRPSELHLKSRFLKPRSWGDLAQAFQGQINLNLDVKNLPTEALPELISVRFPFDDYLGNALSFHLEADLQDWKGKGAFHFETTRWISDTAHFEITNKGQLLQPFHLKIKPTAFEKKNIIFSWEQEAVITVAPFEVMRNYDVFSIPKLEFQIAIPEVSVRGRGESVQVGQGNYQLNLTTVKIPLHEDGNLRELYAAGEVKSSGFALKNSQETWKIPAFLVPFGLDAAKSQFATYIAAPAKTKIPFAQLEISQWINPQGFLSFKDAKGAFQVHMNELPVFIFSALSQSREWQTLLGKNIAVDSEGDFALGEKPNFASALRISGNGVSGEAHLSLEQNKLTLTPGKPPAQFSYTLTPERFLALRQLLHADETLILTEPSDVQLRLTNLGIPLNPNAWMKETNLGFDLRLDRLSAKASQTGQHLELEKISSYVDSHHFAEKITFNVRANHQKQQGELFVEGILEDLYTADGHLNKDNLYLFLKGELVKAPLGLITNLLTVPEEWRGKLVAAFGEVVDSDFKVKVKQKEGIVLAHINGSSGTLSLEGKVLGGDLFLTQPFTAQFQASPALSDQVLAEIVPILGGIVSAENEIVLNIQPEGFLFPLFHYDSSRVQIEGGTLQLGRLYFHKQSSIGEALRLLRQAPSDSDRFLVWFTPLYFNITDGEFTLYRVDMLVSNQFPMAAWGKVNFPKDKVSLILGLSGIAMEQAFGVSGLNQGYMMLIPIKGTLDHVSVDVTKASAQISALIAKMQGSPEGFIIGSVIDLAAGKASKIPKPTTDPLPWAGQIHSRSQSANQNNADPLKQVQKEAVGIIKGLLK